MAAVFCLQEIAHAAPFSGPSAVPAAQTVPASPAPLSIASFVQNPSRLDIPLRAVTLQETHIGTNGKLILHIQDAHANLSGQESLAQALDHFLTRYDLKLVLVEGADRDVSLHAIRKLAPLKEWKIIARRFLYEGIVSGEEYLNLTTEHPMKIRGVEYQELYDESVKAYAALVDRRKDILEYLYQAKKSLNRLKQKHYPAELLKFEEKRRRDLFGEENFEDYFADLVELADLAGMRIEEGDGGFGQTAKLRALMADEQRLDLDLANLQKDRLIEALRSAGRSQAVEEFAASLKRDGRRQITQYLAFRRLFEAARTAGVRPEGFPELDAYGQYLEKFLDIKFDALFVELERLEDETCMRILPTDDAKKIRAIDRFLGLLGSAYKLQMSSQGFAMFEFNEKDFKTESWLAFLNAKLIEAGFFEDLVPYEGHLEAARSDFGKFYKLVGQRDGAFVQNAGRIMREEGQSAAVLVAGGYHTAHLTELLRAEGYSYLVLTPIVTDTTDHVRYEKILLSHLKNQERRLASARKNQGADGGSAEGRSTDDTGANLAQSVAQTKIPRGLRHLSAAARLAQPGALGSRLAQFVKDRGIPTAQLTRAAASLARSEANSRYKPLTVAGDFEPSSVAASRLSGLGADRIRSEVAARKNRSREVTDAARLAVYRAQSQLDSSRYYAENVSKYHLRRIVRSATDDAMLQIVLRNEIWRERGFEGMNFEIWLALFLGEGLDPEDMYPGNPLPHHLILEQLERIFGVLRLSVHNLTLLKKYIENDYRPFSNTPVAFVREIEGGISYDPARPPIKAEMFNLSDGSVVSRLTFTTSSDGGTVARYVAGKVGKIGAFSMSVRAPSVTAPVGSGILRKQISIPVDEGRSFSVLLDDSTGYYLTGEGFADGDQDALAERVDQKKLRPTAMQIQAILDHDEKEAVTLGARLSLSDAEHRLFADTIQWPASEPLPPAPPSMMETLAMWVVAAVKYPMLPAVVLFADPFYWFASWTFENKWITLIAGSVLMFWMWKGVVEPLIDRLNRSLLSQDELNAATMRRRLQVAEARAAAAAYVAGVGSVAAQAIERFGAILSKWQKDHADETVETPRVQIARLLMGALEGPEGLMGMLEYSEDPFEPVRRLRGDFGGDFWARRLEEIRLLTGRAKPDFDDRLRSDLTRLLQDLEDDSNPASAELEAETWDFVERLNRLVNSSLFVKTYKKISQPVSAPAPASDDSQPAGARLADRDRAASAPTEINDEIKTELSGENAALTGSELTAYVAELTGEYGLTEKVFEKSVPNGEGEEYESNLFIVVDPEGGSFIKVAAGKAQIRHLLNEYRILLHLQKALPQDQTQDQKRHVPAPVEIGVDKTAGKVWFKASGIRNAVTIDDAVRGMSGDAIYRLVMDLMRGLDAVHRTGVLHRDINPRNVVANKEGEVMLIDFGLGAIADQSVLESDGTSGMMMYRSLDKLQTAKSDIYSLGRTLVAVLHGEDALRRIDQEDGFDKVGVDALLPRELGVVVRSMISPNPAGRPNLGDVVRVFSNPSNAEKFKQRFGAKSDAGSRLSQGLSGADAKRLLKTADMIAHEFRKFIERRSSFGSGFADSVLKELDQIDDKRFREGFGEPSGQGSGDIREDLRKVLTPKSVQDRREFNWAAGNVYRFFSKYDITVYLHEGSDYQFGILIGPTLYRAELPVYPPEGVQQHVDYVQPWFTTYVGGFKARDVEDAVFVILESDQAATSVESMFTAIHESVHGLDAQFGVTELMRRVDTNDVSLEFAADGLALAVLINLLLAQDRRQELVDLIKDKFIRRSEKYLTGSPAGLLYRQNGDATIATRRIPEPHQGSVYKYYRLFYEILNDGQKLGSSPEDAVKYRASIENLLNDRSSAAFSDRMKQLSRTLIMKVAEMYAEKVKKTPDYAKQPAIYLQEPVRRPDGTNVFGDLGRPRRVVVGGAGIDGDAGGLIYPGEAVEIGSGRTGLRALIEFKKTESGQEELRLKSLVPGQQPVEITRLIDQNGKMSPVSIGRSSANTVQINHAQASRLWIQVSVGPDGEIMIENKKGRDNPITIRRVQPVLFKGFVQTDGQEPRLPFSLGATEGLTFTLGSDQFFTVPIGPDSDSVVVWLGVSGGEAIRGQKISKTAGRAGALEIGSGDTRIKLYFENGQLVAEKSGDGPAQVEINGTADAGARLGEASGSDAVWPLLSDGARLPNQMVDGGAEGARLAAILPASMVRRLAERGAQLAVAVSASVYAVVRFGQEMLEGIGGDSLTLGGAAATAVSGTERPAISEAAIVPGVMSQDGALTQAFRELVRILSSKTNVPIIMTVDEGVLGSIGNLTAENPSAVVLKRFFTNIETQLDIGVVVPNSPYLSTAPELLQRMKGRSAREVTLAPSQAGAAERGAMMMVEIKDGGAPGPLVYLAAAALARTAKSNGSIMDYLNRMFVRMIFALTPTVEAVRAMQEPTPGNLAVIRQYAARSAATLSEMLHEFMVTASAVASAA